MLLAIDVGNTQTVIGVYAQDVLQHHFRLSTNRARTHDEYGVLLREMLAEVGLSLDGFEAAILASVVPPLTTVFSQLCTQRMGIEPLVIGPGVKTGMPIMYESPRDVGADRIVNGIAAYERYRREPGGPHGVIVVDFGTATTFDVISPRGEYLGGSIAPGVSISTEALFLHASKLPRVDLVTPPSAIGKSTVASMQAGILFGYVALVDGMVERMAGELAFAPRVVATGGLAARIGEHSQRIEQVDDFLTLEGLRIIYDRNQAPARRSP